MNGSRTTQRFVYSIDRFNILFVLTIPEIRRVINYTQLKTNMSRYARSLNLIPASEEARMRGYRSQLVVVLPKRELLEELSRSIGDSRHRVFSAELACDRLYQNQSETKTKQRQITKVLRKRWSPNVRIFDSTERAPRLSSAKVIPHSESHGYSPLFPEGAVSYCRVSGPSFFL